MENKRPFEIILNVGLVAILESWVAKNSCHGQTLINELLFLTTLPTLKACNSPYVQYYFKRFFVCIPRKLYTLLQNKIGRWCKRKVNELL